MLLGSELVTTVILSFDLDKDLMAAYCGPREGITPFEIVTGWREP